MPIVIRNGQIVGKMNYIVEVHQYTTRIQLTHMSAGIDCVESKEDLFDEIKDIAINH